MVVSLLLLAAALAAFAAWVDRRADAREAEAEAAFPPEGQKVTLSDGSQVHALVKGDGPDLVLIHGAGGNIRDFSFSLIDTLANRYRVIAFDRPGHGYTPARVSAASPAQQARKLAEAAAILGVNRPIVAGHSFGGAVALAWALNHEAAAVVSLAGVSHPWDTGLGWQYHVNASTLGGALAVPLVTAFVTEGLIQSGLDSVFTPQKVPAGYRDHFGPELTVRRDTQRQNARQVDALLGHIQMMAPRYPAIRIPIEIVHGDADTIVSLVIHAERMIAENPQANLTLLPGVGHMPHHADEAAVIDAIDRAAARADLR